MNPTPGRFPRAAAISVAGLLALAGCAQPDTGTPAASNAAPAEPAGTGGTVTTADTQTPMEPGLKVGERVGNADLQTAGGETVTLASLYSERPVVITFYRGGWCPYCNRALGEWEGKWDQLEAMGVDFVAITPERPDLTTQTAAKDGLHFRILSDASFQAADAFRVRFSLDQDTQSKYKSFGVDLATHNAAGVWDLPAPGTFLIDRSGTVRYAWAEWDYRHRANPDEVIAAARALQR